MADESRYIGCSGNILVFTEKETITEGVNMADEAAKQEQMRQEFEAWMATLPKCPESCDGDLVGQEHDADCPVGKVGGFPNTFDVFCAGVASATARVHKLIEVIQTIPHDNYGYCQRCRLEQALSAPSTPEGENPKI